MTPPTPLVAAPLSGRAYAPRVSALMLSLGIAFCNHPSEGSLARYSFAELHMGVMVKLVFYADSNGNAREAAREALDTLAALEDVLSDYRPTSELMRLSKARPRESHPVSPPLFQVLQTALALAEQTDGAFDPTAGSLTALWRAARRQGTVPDSTAVERARAHVGWNLLALEIATKSVTVTDSATRFDVGGLAKGFALDAARRSLANRGITRVLLQAGGDLLAGDAPPNRAGWSVDLPTGDDAMRSRSAALTNAAVAVSGDTYQYVERDGQRFSHVIDPRTGWGVTHGAVAIVIAPNAVTADGWATALAVQGTVPPNLPAGVHAVVERP